MNPTSLEMSSRVSTPTGWLILAAFGLSTCQIACWMVAVPTNTQRSRQLATTLGSCGMMRSVSKKKYILLVQFNLLPLPFILCVWNRQYSLYRAKNCNIIYADVCSMLTLFLFIWIFIHMLVNVYQHTNEKYKVLFLLAVLYHWLYHCFTSDVGQIDHWVKPLCDPAEDSTSTSTIGSKMDRCDKGQHEGIYRTVLQYGDTEVASQTPLLADY